jgi:V8-like Glu-specific endopeptidase
VRNQLFSVLCLLPLVGCGASVDDGSGEVERVGESAQELMQEGHGLRLFNDETRLSDSNRTLHGYAMSFRMGGGCSGTMIGPNTMMSAAHCSEGDQT